MFPACPSEKSIIKINRNMEDWWNDTDRGKPKYAEKNISLYHFVLHKSHMDWPGIKPALLSEFPAVQR
jgi:hypothetical protein